jgi:hypothetical protein
MKTHQKCLAFHPGVISWRNLHYAGRLFMYCWYICIYVFFCEPHTLYRVPVDISFSPIPTVSLSWCSFMSPASFPNGSLVGAWVGWRAMIMMISSSSGFYVCSSCVYSRSFPTNNLPPEVEMICTSVLTLGSATCTFEKDWTMYNLLAKAQTFLRHLMSFLWWCNMINIGLLCQHTLWTCTEFLSLFPNLGGTR